jgi:hypothetical protein
MSPISRGYEELRARALPGGGFGIQENSNSRPDATAWAIIALKAVEADAGLVEAARRRLAAAQQQDGRVPITPDHPEDYWPTPLAVLAWQGAPAFKAAQERAVEFLWATAGFTLKKDAESPFRHNSELLGWSWRTDTAPWVEPTAMAMMALEAAGRGSGPRQEEGRLLLLDRQIPGGGWNYGNTEVFGNILRPMPESTGMALNALHGHVPREAVQESLAYMARTAGTLRAPWSLGWAILGLGAWGARPASAAAMAEVCLARQERLSTYTTSCLAIILAASQTASGLLALWQA